MAEEVTDRFEVNTKGICILCFRNCSKEPFICSKKGTTISPFMGYLDVNLKKLCAFPGCEDQAFEISNDLELVVTLCDKCEQVGSKFDSLLEQFEKIKSQLEDCCKQWHQLMDEGAKDVQRIQEYRSRMKTGNPLGMFHAAVAEKLRKETISKCLEKVTPETNTRSQSRVPDKGGFDHLDSIQALTLEPNSTLCQPSNDLDFDNEEQLVLALFPSQCSEKLASKNNSRTQVPGKGGRKTSDSFRARTSQPNSTLTPPSDDLDFDFQDEEQFIFPISSQVPPSADTDPFDDVSVRPSSDPELLLVHSSTAVTSALLNTTASTVADADDKHTYLTCSKTFPSMTNLRSHGKIAHESINAAVLKPNVTLAPASGGTTLSRLLDTIEFDHIEFPHKSVVVQKLRDIIGSTDLKCKFCGQHCSSRIVLLHHSIRCHTFEVFSRYLREGVPSEAFKQSFDQFRDEVNVFQGNPINYGCPHCSYTIINNKRPYPISDMKHHIMYKHTDVLFQKLRNQFGAAANGDYQRFENSKRLLTEGIFKTSLEDKGDYFEQKKKKRRRSQVEEPEQKGDPDIQIITIEDEDV